MLLFKRVKATDDEEPVEAPLTPLNSTSPTDANNGSVPQEAGNGTNKKSKAKKSNMGDQLEMTVTQEILALIVAAFFEV